MTYCPQNTNLSKFDQKLSSQEMLLIQFNQFWIFSAVLILSWNYTIWHLEIQRTQLLRNERQQDDSWGNPKRPNLIEINCHSMFATQDDSWRNPKRLNLIEIYFHFMFATQTLRGVEVPHYPAPCSLHSTTCTSLSSRSSWASCLLWSSYLLDYDHFCFA